jgi:signal peptidase I
MIAHLFSPSTAAAVFSTGELPEAVHGLALQEVLIPRVVSWSMTPTIRKGDRLELGRVDALQVGDVIVYRQDRLFICHRIHRSDGSHLYLRGDANDGPSEEISTLDVVGRVTALLRDGRRLAVPPYNQADDQSARHPTLNRYVRWGQEQGRSLGLQLIDSAVALPFVGSVLSNALSRLVIVDIMEHAPLHSLAGYVQRDSFRLCQTNQIKQFLSWFETDFSQITLAIRTGPLHLGICTLDPWCLQIRPLATALGLEARLQLIRTLLKTSSPPTPVSL